MKKVQIITLSCFILFSLSCKQDNPSDKKQTEKQTEGTPLSPTKKAQKERSAQKNNAVCKVEILEAYGSFDLDEEKLHLSIPVASTDYGIKEEHDVSSNDINALLVRVSDGTQRSSFDLPIKHTIVQKYNLDSLGLSMSELENDEELIIITLNSDQEVSDDDLDSLSTCISGLNSYDRNACLRSFRLNDDKRPNEKDGNIIIGF